MCFIREYGFLKKEKKMIANHIHDALAQVQELQRKILEKQRFKGYSGSARAISGALAILAALYLDFIQAVHYGTHLLVWGIVFFLSFFVNYGALINWFLFEPSVKRDVRRLSPTLDALPGLFLGAVLTIVFIQTGQLDYLFGAWMCCYGIASLSSRKVLPKFYWTIGVFYLLSGTIFLLSPSRSFLNSMQMGVTFFIGEWVSAVILHFDNRLESVLRDFFSFNFKDNHNA
jgi:hypothetical protein